MPQSVEILLIALQGSSTFAFHMEPFIMPPRTLTLEVSCYVWGMGQEEQNEACGERKTRFVNMTGSLL